MLDSNFVLLIQGSLILAPITLHIAMCITYFVNLSSLISFGYVGRNDSAYGCWESLIGQWYDVVISGRTTTTSHDIVFVVKSDATEILKFISPVGLEKMTDMWLLSYEFHEHAGMIDYPGWDSYQQWR